MLLGGMGVDQSHKSISSKLISNDIEIDIGFTSTNDDCSTNAHNKKISSVIKV